MTISPLDCVELSPTIATREKVQNHSSLITVTLAVGWSWNSYLKLAKNIFGFFDFSLKTCFGNFLQLSKNVN